MADSRKMPPLSGEIMTGPASPRAGARAGADAVDADFVTLSPRSERAATSIPQAPVPVRPGMDLLRADVEPARPTQRWQPAGAGFWLGGATAAALAFWVAGGHAVLRQDEIEASPLKVAALMTRIEDHSGRQSLLIDGELRNPSERTEALPKLTINVTTGDGRTTRYSLGVEGRSVEALGTWRFSSRLEAPESGVRSVFVTLGREG